MMVFSVFSGSVEKAVTELIIDFDTRAEEEGPYEALYNAVSCHSLDSTASGRSSDRDSVNKETEATGARTAGVRPVRGPGLSLPGAVVAAMGAGKRKSGAGSCFRGLSSPAVLSGALSCLSCSVW